MKKIVWLFAFFSIYMAYAQHTEVLYLSGTGSDHLVMWDFFCTAGRNSGQWSQIPVPSNWEFQGFGQFTYGHDKERLNESGRYRHSFSIPENWKDKRVHIVFEGSMTDTEVKINGNSAGEMHQGGFYQFRYDISKWLKFGKDNELEVTVHKFSANESVENAERKSDFWVYGGIYRPVWLEALPSTHIERMAIDAKADGTFHMDVYLKGEYRKTEIKAQVKSLDGKVFGDELSLLVNQKDSVRIISKYFNPALWSAEFPNRYLIEVQLIRNGKVIHTRTEKFGFRTAELRPGDGFYVNGAKVKLKGVNRHTHWPTSGRAINYSIALEDALLIKEMNMNAVRMSHYPPDSYFLDICDSLGLYVIDELTGWQSAYDTKAGRKLVKELITRDVNHPCVVMWANGNEGGFNFELLPEYARYDIQHRLVFHPWLEEDHVNTYHYIPYGVGTQFFFQGNKVFYPTEFMHGLYDGGHGAGLDDFWNLMQDNPLSAGGFLWDLMDQGVVRNDRNNEMDTDGNHAADGILGPYREKEGSFYTIREIWSPVFLERTGFLSATFDGTFKVSNRYQFTNLNQCRFLAEWVKLDYSNGIAQVHKRFEVSAPEVAPGMTGLLTIPKPEKMNDFDVLYLTAFDPHGHEIYTWSERITSAKAFAEKTIPLVEEEVRLIENKNHFIFEAADTRLLIDKADGTISGISVSGRNLSLTNGPRFTNEAMDVISSQIVKEDGLEKVECMYRLKDSKATTTRNIVRVGLTPAGWIEIVYSFDVGGYHDHIGVTFDYPEEKVKHIKWLGDGPYRVWKNRMKGVSFNLWEKAYNNTVTGESWVYPEFKGFYSHLYAADLTTEEGVIKIVTATDDLFLHLFTPDKPALRNNDNTLGKFPNGQLSILNAISPVGTKFKLAKDLGPQSQQNYFMSSSHAEPLKGKVYLKFIPE